MKRSRIRGTFLVVICLLFGPATGWAADVRDGNWWNNELSAPQRVAYAIGFLDGQVFAQLRFQGAALYGMANPKTGKFDAGRADTAQAISKLATDGFARDFGNVTAGNLVDGLNHIFADYRNARISVLDAIIVVARSIGGMPDDQVEKMLESKRSGATAAFK